MRQWEIRSLEEANLLNPAFLSILCYQVIDGYQKVNSLNTAYIFPFLVIPLILHKTTRISLPRSIATTFATWTTKLDGSIAKISYPERARSLVPYIKEAIFFGVKNGFILIDDTGLLKNQKRIAIPTKPNIQFTPEVIECYKKALFCGRWLALTGKIETIMALLGVKP